MHWTSYIGFAVQNQSAHSRSLISGVFRMCERRGPRGSGGQKSPRSWRFFVTDCLNFDVLEEKICKTAKKTLIKNYGRLGGGQGQAPPPPKYATVFDRSFSLDRHFVGWCCMLHLLRDWQCHELTVISVQTWTFGGDKITSYNDRNFFCFASFLHIRRRPNAHFIAVCRPYTSTP